MVMFLHFLNFSLLYTHIYILQEHNYIIVRLLRMLYNNFDFPKSKFSNTQKLFDVGIFLELFCLFSKFFLNSSTIQQSF